MPFVATGMDLLENVVVGNGHCAVFVQSMVGIGKTSGWRQGIKVKGNSGVIAEGTVIATFQGGRYRNSTEGLSHAAIYIRQTDEFIEVWDQYIGRSVQKSKIYFKRGTYSKVVNDGDNYFVVEWEASPMDENDICLQSDGGRSWKADQW